MHKLIFTSTAIALLILIPAFASGEVYIPDMSMSVFMIMTASIPL